MISSEKTPSWIRHLWILRFLKKRQKNHQTGSKIVRNDKDKEIQNHWKTTLPNTDPEPMTRHTKLFPDKFQEKSPNLEFIAFELLKLKVFKLDGYL